MEGKIPLSVVILTKNEAGRIRDCIQSVAWADEVLVIDDESTDDTVRIAEELGARVVRRKMDIEGRHRNWAYAQARHEWILSLDADERVTPALAQEIAALFGDGPPLELYAIPRRNYIGDHWIQHGGWYPSAQLKLFKRSVFRWEETTVHPRAISDRPCGTLEHDLIHYSYRDLADFIGKMNWQTTLEAQKWLADGRRMTFGKALWRTLDRFVRAYVSKKGYRDGFLGYIVAALGGFYQFLSWAKYAEQRRPARVEDVVEPFRDLAIDKERYDAALLMSHLCAYRRTGEEASGQRVLEVGCGVGYGAYYLAHLAKQVVGIDLDQHNIRQARTVFRRPNLDFDVMDATQLTFPDASFDVVGSFQVIEHIPEHLLEEFLRQIARVLTPDGRFVVSTLNLDHNRKGKSDYRKPDFHVKEFTAPELRELLEGIFPSVDLYGLYPSAGYRAARRLKKWGLDRIGPADANPIARFLRDVTTDAHRLMPRCDRSAIDLIAICRKQ